MSKQVNNMVAILAIFDPQKGLGPGSIGCSVILIAAAIRITEQPILLTKSKINRTGYKFSKYFR